jgi:hypothetical protein
VPRAVSIRIGTSGGPAQLAAQVAPVAVGQGEVEDDDVGRPAIVGQRGAGVGGRARQHCDEALAPERRGERLGDPRLVLDDEDARAGRGLRGHGPSDGIRTRTGFAQP